MQFCTISPLDGREEAGRQAKAAQHHIKTFRERNKKKVDTHIQLDVEEVTTTERKKKDEKTEKKILKPYYSNRLSS